MKIVKAEAKRIRYKSVMVRDKEGHSHPGAASEHSDRELYDPGES